MFGHILRSNESTPAFVSLKFAVSNTYKSRRGRHQCNLFNTLIDDLKCRNFVLKTPDDLYKLRNDAFDRAHWRNSFGF